jgi:hypothetical protein
MTIRPISSPPSDIRFPSLRVTPESRQRPNSSPNILCGQPYKKTATLGPELVTPANALKFLATPSLHMATSPFLPPVFYIFISTWSVPSRPQRDFNNASLLWTNSHAGPKPSLSSTLQQKQCYTPYSPVGSHVLAVHRASLLTRDASSSLICSTTWRSFAASTSAGRPPANPPATFSWNDFTAP